MSIFHGSNDGNPIVHSDPESMSARVFQTLAQIIMEYTFQVKN